MRSEQRKLRKEEDIAGLDINSGRIVASHFSIHGERQILDRLIAEDYNPALSPKELAAQIRTLWKKHKMPTRTVHTCLHSRSLVVRYFQHKNINIDELPQVLSLEAEEALQQPPNQIAMDWQLNSSEENGDLHDFGLSGTLIAAPKKTVAQHLRFIRSAGLYTAQVEVSCAALNNLYTFISNEDSSPPACLINLTTRTADIIMYSENNSFPRALFSAKEQWEDNQDYLLENLQNALLYHHLKVKQSPIKKIILAGRIPNPDRFPEQLSEKTSLPVELMDIQTDDRLDNKYVKIPQDHLKRYNLETGIGLGIRRLDYGIL